MIRIELRKTEFIKYLEKGADSSEKSEGDQS